MSSAYYQERFLAARSVRHETLYGCVSISSSSVSPLQKVGSGSFAGFQRSVTLDPFILGKKALEDRAGSKVEFARRVNMESNPVFRHSQEATDPAALPENLDRLD